MFYIVFRYFFLFLIFSSIRHWSSYLWAIPRFTSVSSNCYFFMFILILPVNTKSFEFRLRPSVLARQQHTLSFFIKYIVVYLIECFFLFGDSHVTLYINLCLKICLQFSFYYLHNCLWVIFYCFICYSNTFNSYYLFFLCIIWSNFCINIAY